MSEWISVKDRLPGLYEWVLVAVDFPGAAPWIATAYRNKISVEEEWHWWWFGYPSEIGEVTHWMHLPDLPKEG